MALEPTEVLSISERDFFRLLETRPEITRRLLAGLTIRLMSRWHKDELIVTEKEGFFISRLQALRDVTAER